MKKKTLTIILPLCAAMAMAACGGNADTAEVNETTVIEESMEADAQAEAEAPTMDEEAEVVEAEEVVEEEQEEVEEIYNPADKYEGKFYMVSQDVLDNDKSEEYGIYSTSCFDLDQYLDEEGIVTDFYELDKGYEYTGRWEYPDITQCDMFNDIYLSYRSDRFERFYFKDKSNNETSLLIHSGIGSYNNAVDRSEMSEYSDNPMLPCFMFTTETTEGTTDVISEILKYGFIDGETGQYQMEYTFHIGNFTAKIQCAETEDEENLIEMTEEEIQEIVDSIRLTNGLER